MARQVILTDHAWPDTVIERGILEAAGFELVAGPAVAGTAAQVAELVAAHDPAAIMTCWAPVPAAAVRSPSDLRIVARLGVGLDNIAVDAASARGAWVTNVPDYCVEEVSDHALALLLAHFRGVAVLDRDTKAARWNPAHAQLERFRNLTIGIVGLGRIGQATARKLEAFGCTVLAVDSAPAAARPGIAKVSMAVLRERADAIVLHVPLTASTRGMVDDAFIAGCRRRPFLVNVSRGGLVDNAALLRGLANGALRGAALDVIDGEPSPPSELLPPPAGMAPPHVAFLSVASLIELRRRASEEVVRVLGGQAPLHPCNRPAGAATPVPVSFDVGVASDIQVVEDPDGPYVLKRALPRLRVAAEWRSDPARSLVEAAALRAVASIIGQDAVPRVLWTDPARHEFAMELVPPRLRNWKRDLMSGQIDAATAARVGRLLGQLHAGSALRPDLREQFADTRCFEELRVRLYFDRVAERNPNLAAEIAAVGQGIAEHRAALVHGDFSPKNILADGADVVLLDCEVAHWGDPRFDLAFCLTHLALKSLRRTAPVAALAGAALALVHGYRETGPAIIDAALVRILACLMLARLEGDSPVDYLSDLDQPEVKCLAIRLLHDPLARSHSGNPIMESLA